MGQLLHIALEHHLAGVAQRIDRVAHAVDEALVVESFTVQQLEEVGFHFLVVLGVVQMLADILHHLHDHQVRAAVARAFEGAQRRRHRGIGIRARRSDDTGGKGGVVAAAVLGVQQQGHIQHPGLQLGVLHIRPEHPQKVLRRGERGVRAVDIHAAVALIVVIGVVAVDRQHREDAGQLDALAQHVGDAQVRDPGVIGRQRQHAAGHGVHHVMAGSLHDDVPGEVGGHRAAFSHHGTELFQLRGGGQLAEQQQIARFLKGEPAAAAAVDELLHIEAAVVQPPVAGALVPVHRLEGHDVGNVGQPRQHALAVLVPQAGFDPKFLTKLFADAVMLGTERLLLLEIAQNVLQIVHGIFSPSPLPPRGGTFSP